MRRNTFIALLLVAAACATTPQGRELQIANAIRDTNNAAVTALDFGIIKADEGAAIQAITQVATADLKRAIGARRSGAPLQEWERIVSIIEDALIRAAVLLEGSK